MALIGAAFGLGFTLGPLLGGELADRLRRAGLARRGLVADAPPPSARSSSSRRGTRAAPRACVRFAEVRKAFADSRIRAVSCWQYLVIVSFSASRAMFTLFGLAASPGRSASTGRSPIATPEQAPHRSGDRGRYFAGSAWSRRRFKAGSYDGSSPRSARPSWPPPGR